MLRVDYKISGGRVANWLVDTFGAKRSGVEFVNVGAIVHHYKGSSRKLVRLMNSERRFCDLKHAEVFKNGMYTLSCYMNQGHTEL